MNNQEIENRIVRYRLSKKSSFCWAFFIIHDIISVGDKKCCKAGKWNEGYLK